MNTNLATHIDAFAGLHVVVLGEAVLDSYLEGATGRVCREAPVPLVTLTARKDAPGGAANTAVNVRSLGGRVSFLSVIGDDVEGAFLRRALEQRGVSAEHLLTAPGRQTIAKNRVLAGAQILVRFDQGTSAPLDEETGERLIDRLARLMPDCDALIASDYGYGVLTPRVLGALARLQARHARVLVADSRRRLREFRGAGVTAVKPNYEEVCELLNLRPDDDTNRVEAVLRRGDEVLDKTGARLAAVTLDREGAVLFERGRPPYRTYTTPSRRSCVAGAGDTFVSVLTLALAAGAPTHAAGELAAAAAAVVVGKDGTADCSAQELREAMCPAGKYLPSLERLAARVEFFRRQGHRILFTNGCFDLLHSGHIASLNRAKALGDVLVVAVNSDASIRRLKGPGRPINTLEDRVQVLSALSCIDLITSFDEDTCCRLVRALRPDVFVKGGDYSRDAIPEAPLVEELGGVVQILPYVQDRSTSGLIERIHETYSRPVLEAL